MHKSCMWSGGSGDDRVISCISRVCAQDAPEMIAAGPFASYVPGKPELPKDEQPNLLMVFANKGKDVTHWFLAANDDELKSVKPVLIIVII